MTENKLLEMINLYFDGELGKSKEVNFFTLLASDQTARDYFKQLSVIRSAVDNDTEDFPAELEERILRSVGSKAVAKTGMFSNIKIFKHAEANGRLYGLAHEGGWFHFSTPESLSLFAQEGHSA